MELRNYRATNTTKGVMRFLCRFDNANAIVNQTFVMVESVLIWTKAKSPRCSSSQEWPSSSNLHSARSKRNWVAHGEWMTLFVSLIDLLSLLLLRHLAFDENPI